MLVESKILQVVVPVAVAEGIIHLAAANSRTVSRYCALILKSHLASQGSENGKRRRQGQSYRGGQGCRETLQINSVR